jgi:hypothetical protein
MYKVDYPFTECDECENIDDCPHPVVELDNSGVCIPIPPPECPKPARIALTKRKRKKDGI